MFQNPQFIYSIPLLLILLGLLYIRSRRRRRSRVAKLSEIYEFPGNSLNNHSVFRSRLKVSLTILGTVSLLLALARPQFGFQWVEVKKNEKSMLLVLDISNSMLVEDVYPNRLERAKLIIHEIVDRAPNRKIGLIIFAGSAFLQCPITDDHKALLETLEIQTPSMLSNQGSNFSKALLLTTEILKDPENDSIILLSDGEDHSTGLLQTIDYLRNQKMKVHSICIGTTKGGLVPNHDSKSPEPYFYDINGNVVYSKANPEYLLNLAHNLQGNSVHFHSENYSIRKLDKLLTTNQGKNSELVGEKKIPVEYFQIPLFLAFLLLAFEYALGTRKFDAPTAKLGSDLQTK